MVVSYQLGNYSSFKVTVYDLFKCFLNFVKRGRLLSLRAHNLSKGVDEILNAVKVGLR